MNSGDFCQRFMMQMMMNFGELVVSHFWVWDKEERKKKKKISGVSL